jgi:hypothetical protein
MGFVPCFVSDEWFDRPLATGYRGCTGADPGPQTTAARWDWARWFERAGHAFGGSYFRRETIPSGFLDAGEHLLLLDGRLPSVDEQGRNFAIPTGAPKGGSAGGHRLKKGLYALWKKFPGRKVWV